MSEGETYNKETIDAKLEAIHKDVIYVKEQTTKTNGRVNKHDDQLEQLRTWKTVITTVAAVSALSAIPNLKNILEVIASTQ